MDLPDAGYVHSAGHLAGHRCGACMTFLVAKHYESARLSGMALADASHGGLMDCGHLVAATSTAFWFYFYM